MQAVGGIRDAWLQHPLHSEHAIHIIYGNNNFELSLLKILLQSSNVLKRLVGDKIWGVESTTLFPRATLGLGYLDGVYTLIP